MYKRQVQDGIVYFMEVASHPDVMTIQNLKPLFIKAVLIFAMTALPMLLLSGFAGIVAAGAQTKFLFSSKLLAFKFDRLNPLQGIKRMFSLRGIIELVKALLKVVVLGAVIYQTMRAQIMQFPRFMDMSIMQAIAVTTDIVFEIVKNAAVLFVFVALADFGYQWWDYEKNLRMSKQEIKEEYKESEGDPQIKAKIKERQQMMARQRMMQNVPGADVVIRNPTHYAVAIRYDAEKNSSPVVVAKGADHIALNIVRIAEENNVVVLENRPLARGLYEAVELDQEIPEQFFKPVAEVLAYVYNLKKKGVGKA